MPSMTGADMFDFISWHWVIFHRIILGENFMFSVDITQLIIRMNIH